MQGVALRGDKGEPLHVLCVDGSTAHFLIAVGLYYYYSAAHAVRQLNHRHGLAY